MYWIAARCPRIVEPSVMRGHNESRMLAEHGTKRHVRGRDSAARSIIGEAAPDDAAPRDGRSDTSARLGIVLRYGRLGGHGDVAIVVRGIRHGFTRVDVRPAAVCEGFRARERRKGPVLRRRRRAAIPGRGYSDRRVDSGGVRTGSAAQSAYVRRQLRLRYFPPLFAVGSSNRISRGTKLISHATPIPSAVSKKRYTA